MTERRIRVLIGKPGLDGHDRGAKTVASVLRDHGMEVVYTGLHQTPAMIAEAAAQEDVDVVGLSLLSGAHMALFPRVRDELAARGKGDVLLVGGGIIPHDDMVLTALCGDLLGHLATTVDAVFVGALGRLANDGGPSAIDKRAVDDARPAPPDLPHACNDERRLRRRDAAQRDRVCHRAAQDSVHGACRAGA